MVSPFTKGMPQVGIPGQASADGETQAGAPRSPVLHTPGISLDRSIVENSWAMLDWDPEALGVPT